MIWNIVLYLHKIHNVIRVDFMLFKMYQYKPFEQINSSLSRLSNNKYDITELCSNEEYTFYECKEKNILPSTYVIYKMDSNPKKYIW